MSDIRVPTQKRSIEKKNKIIEKGFELMCENGYYNTNTAQIAEYAGVSTGIVYQYFKDKKDIFMEGVKNYANQIMYPMLNILESGIIDLASIDTFLYDLINKFIESHTISKKAHEELMAMSHLDEDVGDIFKDSEMRVTEQIVDFLEKSNIHIENPKEKIHIAINMIDNLCHEVVYHKHNSINYDVMTSEVIKYIKQILN